MKRLGVRRVGLGLAAAVAALMGTVVGASPASAHPLGNLTVNTYSGLVVSPDQVLVERVLDLAELPTVQARQRIADSSENAEKDRTCAELSSGLAVKIGSTVAVWTVTSSTLELRPGQGGLDTMRVSCSLTTSASVNGSTAISVTDTAFIDRIGWREITAVGDGVTLNTDLPSVSRSQKLTAYPPGVAPLRQVDVQIAATPGGPRLTSGQGGSVVGGGVQNRGADRLTSFFNRLLAHRDLTVALAFGCAALALVLGGIHSLAPGHGKTLMAAAVVGRRGGGARQVLTIGATVAVTHTAGVLTLGLAIWLSQAAAPDRLLPWLTVASGVLLVITGAALLWRRVLVGKPNHHHHGPGVEHHHGEHGHSHSHGPQPVEVPAALSRRWLIAMGMAGGLVPTPSALVVLLGATALGRPWFGVVLVAIYGIGMALTLLMAGVALVRLEGFVTRHWYNTRWLAVTLRAAPLVTAAVLMVGGVSIAMRAAGQL